MFSEQLFIVYSGFETSFYFKGIHHKEISKKNVNEIVYSFNFIYYICLFKNNIL